MGPCTLLCAPCGWPRLEFKKLLEALGDRANGLTKCSGFGVFLENPTRRLPKIINQDLARNLRQPIAARAPKLGLRGMHKLALVVAYLCFPLKHL